MIGVKADDADADGWRQINVCCRCEHCDGADRIYYRVGTVYEFWCRMCGKKWEVADQ